MYHTWQTYPKLSLGYVGVRLQQAGSDSKVMNGPNPQMTPLNSANEQAAWLHVGISNFFQGGEASTQRRAKGTDLRFVGACN